MKFSEIPGNKEIKRKLIQTVLDQRVSHAQLFYGPDDSSKLPLAIAYAQFINCTGRVIPGRKVDEHGFPVETDSCGECPSCIKYQKLAHPDLHFIYPVASTKKLKKPKSRDVVGDWREFLLETRYSGSLLSWYDAIGIENKQGIISAEDCNEIITTLSYKSYESEYKVMIIWMVEKLFHSAAPKILKILEEPPEKTLFLLVSEDPDEIIKTILSRTLMVRIPRNDTAAELQGEDNGERFQFFRSWMRSCYSGKYGDLVNFSSEIGKAGREKQKSFLGYALSVLGDSLRYNYCGEIPAAYEGEELKFLQGFAPQLGKVNIHEFCALVSDAINHIERNAHGTTLFLDLSLKIMRHFNPKLIPLQ